MKANQHSAEEIIRILAQVGPGCAGYVFHPTRRTATRTSVFPLLCHSPT